MSMKKYILAVLLAGIGLHAFGQTDSIPDIQLWNLRECIDYALANNLQIKRSALNVETNQVNLRQYRMNQLPAVNASSSYGYNWGRGLDPTTNQFVTSQRNAVADAGVNASVTLFNGMRIQNTIKQGSKDLFASEEDLAKMRNDVSLNVTNYFINVVFNRELVENAKSQLASTQQQLERTKKQVAAGALSRSEELNLEAQVATNEVNLINQTNALTMSLLQLKQTLQIPASAPFDIDVPQLDPEDLVMDHSRDEVYAMAREIMPEIKASQLRVESSYFGIKAARGNLYPRLSINGSVNTTYSESAESRFIPDGGYRANDSLPIARVAPFRYVAQNELQSTNQQLWGMENNIFALTPTGSIQRVYMFDQQVKDNFYKAVRLTITIPIFNNYTARAQLQRSLIASEQAKVNALEVEQTLRQNIETSFNDALAASKSYESSLKQVAARDEAFRMTKQRFDIGAVNYVDYQVAENNLFQAKSDLARAKYNFIFRKKLLDFYQGKPIEL
jgi:outer membrane protein